MPVSPLHGSTDTLFPARRRSFSTYHAGTHQCNTCSLCIPAVHGLDRYTRVAARVCNATISQGSVPQLLEKKKRKKTTQEPLVPHTRHKQKNAHFCTHACTHTQICFHRKKKKTTQFLQAEHSCHSSLSSRKWKRISFLSVSAILPHSSEHKLIKLPIWQVCAMERIHVNICRASEWKLKWAAYVLHKGGSRVSWGREPQGSPSDCCVVHSGEAALRSFWYILTGRHKMKNFVGLHGWASGGKSTLPNPTASPTPKNQPIMVVLSCADETKITSALPCSALFLTASQTHAVTQPHSACLLALLPLGPSAFFLFISQLLHSTVLLFNIKAKLRWRRT